MPENSFESFFRAYESISRSVQAHLSRFFLPPQSDRRDRHSLSSDTRRPLSSLISIPFSEVDEGSELFRPKKEVKPAGPLTKEELGRATWTLLHSIAAQYPDHPTRQQKHDAKELMVIISRLYPCKECADHFKEVLKASPVQAGSQEEFSQYLCHIHNVVNRSLGKVTFPCNRVNARWGKLDCPERNCDLQGT
ncbi:FAD-linked sulfhydryl oxidase ERV1-like [Zingiber officinale]|uniref:FAD-linked sulfhydryl oxidase ERV1-like n=1 Tax=Zingiber officinale TaxID=94328 RepID=UPI001C4AC2C6|nr:FAD-linked sulfhydryl oxidase ERV1-like [Zingiber officinale]